MVSLPLENRSGRTRDHSIPYHVNYGANLIELAAASNVTAGCRGFAVL